MICPEFYQDGRFEDLMIGPELLSGWKIGRLEDWILYRFLLGLKDII